MKRFMFYFVSTIIIGILFYFGLDYQLRLWETSANTYNMMPFVLFLSIFPVLIGCLIRLPKLVVEIREKRQWSVDWIKLAAIGIPSLYVAMVPLVTFSFGLNLPLAFKLMFLGDHTFTYIAGIVFGYVLLDSLKK